MPKPPREDSVAPFLASLDHPRLAEIQRLRELVLASYPGVTERIKWNAPSFCVAGDDRVTMRLQPKNRLELIFHRGAKARGSDGFTFEDPSGFLHFITPDRAMLSFADADDLTEKTASLREVLPAWFAATRS